MTILLSLLFPLIVCGLLAWFLQTLPMPNPAKTACYLVLALIVVIVLFRALG